MEAGGEHQGVAAELETGTSARFLAGTVGDLEVTCYRDGTVTDPGSAGTVTVTDELGTVLSSGAATVVGGSTGKLRYTPTAAAMALVNRLTVTWAGVVLGADPAITLTTQCELVGQFLFSEAEARGFGDGAMADATVYPDDVIREARDRIHDDFESIVGYPLGRRCRLEEFVGEGSARARLTTGQLRGIRAVSWRDAGSSSWTAFTAGELADTGIVHAWGMIERESLGAFARGRRYRVSVEAGRDIPGALRRAGLIVLRNTLVASNISARALFENNQAGQFRLAVADATVPGRWYGLPEADAALGRHRAGGFW